MQELKKKQENQVKLLRQKQKSDKGVKKLQNEIQFIKAQKVRQDLGFVTLKYIYMSKFGADLFVVAGLMSAQTLIIFGQI